MDNHIILATQIEQTRLYVKRLGFSVRTYFHLQDKIVPSAITNRRCDKASPIHM